MAHEPGSGVRRERQDVVVRDVQMPFISMIVFMVKWAVAAIPAILILAFISAFAGILALSAFRAIGGPDGPRISDRQESVDPYGSSAPQTPIASPKRPPSTPAEEYVSRFVRYTHVKIEGDSVRSAVGIVENRGEHLLVSLHGVVRYYGAIGSLISQVPYTVQNLRPGERRSIRNEIPDYAETVRIEFDGGVLSP